MNRLEHLLTVLGEEGCEIAQAASKANRFGINEQRDLPTSNRDRIEMEFNDLLGVIEMLRTDGVVIEVRRDLIDAKKEKVEKYLRYSAECGTLQEQPK